MTEPDPAPPTSKLAWTTYHVAIVEFLKRTDPKVWNWFAQSTADPKATEEVRFELLKSTYRIDRDAQPELYRTAADVAKGLGVDSPITIYQAQNPQGLNASLAFVPDEVHLILHGPIVERLTPGELRALFGHEIAHHLLWHGGNCELFIADEMLRAMTNDQQAHPAHLASLRLTRLYNEIFCDRGALLATDDLSTAISMQLKIETGLQEVSPDAYLRQAEEIFERGKSSTTGLTHPEGFIRARALKLWHEGNVEADKMIAEMIEGAPGIDELDLLAQERVAGATRRVIDVHLSRKWMQTDAVLSQARLYFDDYAAPVELLVDRELASHVRVEPSSMRDYFCFVLLDFVSADRDLDEASLAAALQIAEQLAIKPRFQELARQELRLRKQQIEKIDEQKDTIILAADRMVLSSQ
jgi:hypothetical protein